jgi:NADH-quinone oxidoreductase subunit A
MNPIDVTYWPLVVYFVAVLIVVASMIVVSYLLGERHRERATGQPYESGITSTGSARLRFSVKFYIVAMFFVIFDVESIFIFAWAVSFRESGWAGYFEALVFIMIMVAALIYLWGTGSLDWALSSQKKGHKTGY